MSQYPYRKYGNSQIYQLTCIQLYICIQYVYNYMYNYMYNYTRNIYTTVCYIFTYTLIFTHSQPCVCILKDINVIYKYTYKNIQNILHECADLPVC